MTSKIFSILFLLGLTITSSTCFIIGLPPPPFPQPPPPPQPRPLPPTINPLPTVAPTTKPLVTTGATGSTTKQTATTSSSTGLDQLITSWVKTTGTGYNNIVNNVYSLSADSSYVYVSANSIPDYSIGPWTNNPNKPSAQAKTYK